MIYDKNEEYSIKLFPEVEKYLDQLSVKDRAKVSKYIEYLRQHQGILDEPYSKHIRGKLRELRVDFGRNRHRIFYFTFINRNIILLHAFLKNTPKTPASEINRAEKNLNLIMSSKDLL